MKPELSIIIPCYNGADTIPDLARNLNAYEHDAVEIVFIDDGSTDDSAAIARQHIPQAKVFQQANGGVAAARNTGATKAQGAFLTFLDCDDFLIMEHLLPRLEQLKQSGTSILASSWRMEIRNQGKIQLEDIRPMPTPKDPVEALLEGSWWGPPHAYLLKRSAYEEIGGSDETLVNAQDFDLWLRLGIAGMRFDSSSLLAGHYIRDLERSSLARGPRERYWTDTQRVVEKALRAMETNNTLTQQREQAAAKRLHTVARGLYGIDQNRFKTIIQRIRELDPSFLPTGSFSYRWAAKLFGFERAEWIASIARRSPFTSGKT